MRRLLTVAGTLVLLAASGVARATPYVPPHLLFERPGTPAVIEDWTTPGIVPADILHRLSLVSAFEKSMQYTGSCADAGVGADTGADADSDAAAPCEFGGEIEVQSGPGNAIIQSDNTQEAIWIWSWDRQLNGATSYAPQVANAFEFLSVFPGWLKWEGTGDTGPDYYSVYNCAWGVRAVVELEAAGDTSHHAYGEMCAEHIEDYAITVAQKGGLINMAPAAFAASGLWIWGQAEGDTMAQQKAAAIGAVVKAWIDATPSEISFQTWAVTGAAAYDGVLGSYMKANPGELDAWVQKNAPLVGGWIDESQPVIPEDWTDWRNAHSAWNMLAQFDTAAILGEDGTGPHNQIALGIFSKLVAQDVQGNGGIPGSQQLENDDEDETWITAYLVYFGMRPLLAGLDLDAGIAEAGAPDGGPADAGGDAGTAVADASMDSSTGLQQSSHGGGCDQAGDGGSWPLGLPAIGLVGACAFALRRRRAVP